MTCLHFCYGLPIDRVLACEKSQRWIRMMTMMMLFCKDRVPCLSLSAVLSRIQPYLTFGCVH